MSGPLGSSQWMYSTGAGGFYPYEIGQSLRFNDDDSAYLSRTPASAGNRKTWTWSGWVKRGNLGTAQHIFGAYAANSDAGYIEVYFDASNQFFVSGWNTVWRVSSEVFRDTSAWYHVVISTDTTQATAADRFKIYVNNRQVTAFSTNNAFTLNADTGVNATAIHYIGAKPQTGTQTFDGYMAEVNFIDGTALDPTSFGEFKSGVWIPKKYTGSYGTNGFYLSFADSAAIGDDLSGNANDWTPSGLASTDVLLDSPTNNYAVLNPLDKNSAITTADGNLSYTASNDRIVKATFSVTSGKWYWEFAPGGGGSTSGCGVINPAVNIYAVVNLNLAPAGVSYLGNGNKSINGTATAYGATYTSGDTIGIALDLDANEVTFYKNNVSQGAISLTAGLEWFPAFDQNAGTNVANFGQSPFAYTPPAGFLALNTANLPEPTITPALDDVPADYFNTVLYTGTGAAQSITGVGFQPDWTWIKGRSGATDHGLYDAVRGVQLQLESNTNAAETTETTGLTAFGVDGFTVGALAQLNTSTATYVAWNWKANGAGVANTDGTISSTVSANQKAGFSIVSYTGNLTAAGNSTVGHGLGVAPDMVITKARNAVSGWIVQFPLLGQNKTLNLQTTGAVGDSVASGGGVLPLPTATTFGISWITGLGVNGHDHIAYCFAEVEGYSKFGSYTGNGSTDGPFIYCGFRPAFVMWKVTSTTEAWTIFDVARDPYNFARVRIHPNYSNVEAVGSEAAGNIAMDLLSNGFKVRNTSTNINASGQTYIFMAFSEAPFKYSNAR